MVAMVAAVMASISCTIVGRESALAGESQGLRCRVPRVRWCAMRGRDGWESLSSRSEVMTDARLGGFCFPERRGMAEGFVATADNEGKAAVEVKADSGAEG